VAQVVVADQRLAAEAGRVAWRGSGMNCVPCETPTAMDLNRAGSMALAYRSLPQYERSKLLLQIGKSEISLSRTAAPGRTS
jgi:hypothetical protein